MAEMNFALEDRDSERSRSREVMLGVGVNAELLFSWVRSFRGDRQVERVRGLEREKEKE
jgi:transposase-like protein